MVFRLNCRLKPSQPDDYVIGTGESQTLKKFVQTAFELVDLDWRDHVVTNPNLFRPSDLQTSCCNPQKAYRQLKWEAHYKMRDVINSMMADALNSDIKFH